MFDSPGFGSVVFADAPQIRSHKGPCSRVGPGYSAKVPVPGAQNEIGAQAITGTKYTKQAVTKNQRTIQSSMNQVMSRIELF